MEQEQLDQILNNLNKLSSVDKKEREKYKRKEEKWYNNIIDKILKIFKIK